MIFGQGNRFWMSLILGASLLAGCSRDPQVAKKKHFDRGDSYFEAGKYREAAIEYQNAIQIDPRFAPAHFKLAESYLKLQDWQRGYQELLRSIDLQPDDWKAQLTLGNILLASGRFPDARDRAGIILKGDPQNAEAQMLLANADAEIGRAHV